MLLSYQNNQPFCYLFPFSVTLLIAYLKEVEIESPFGSTQNRWICLGLFTVTSQTWSLPCMVTSPIKRKVKPDTLVLIELNAVVDISVDAGFLVVITNLLSDKSKGLVIERAAFPLDP